MLPTESHLARANGMAGSLGASLLLTKGERVGTCGRLQKDGQILGMDEEAVGRKFVVIFPFRILIFVRGRVGGAMVVGRYWLCVDV